MKPSLQKVNYYLARFNMDSSRNNGDFQRRKFVRICLFH